MLYLCQKNEFCSVSIWPFECYALTRLSFTCQTAQEKRGEKAPSKSLRMYLYYRRKMKWRVEIQWSCFPSQGNQGVGEIDKSFYVRVWETRGHITLVMFKFLSSQKNLCSLLFVHFCHSAHHTHRWWRGGVIFIIMLRYSL